MDEVLKQFSEVRPKKDLISLASLDSFPVRGEAMNLPLVDQSREKAYPSMFSTFRKTVFIISLSSFHEDIIKRFPPSFKTRLLS